MEFHYIYYIDSVIFIVYTMNVLIDITQLTELYKNLSLILRSSSSRFILYGHG